MPSAKKTSARSRSEKEPRLDDAAGLVQELERLAQRADAHLRAARADEGADGRARARRSRVRPGRATRTRSRRLVVERLEQRLGPGKRALEPAALVGRDAVREKTGIDAEPRSEPLDRLARRARLAALDLRHVLLREPLAGEVALRQAGGDTELAEALAEAKPVLEGGAALVGECGRIL